MHHQPEKAFCFFEHSTGAVGSNCCDIGHVKDVKDIADMRIGRNAIIVEDVEDVEDKTLLYQDVKMTYSPE